MDVQKNADRFDQAASSLPENISSVLAGIPRSVKANLAEIRLRVGRPVALSRGGQCWFVDKESQLHNIPRHCFVVNGEDLSRSVVRMCSYSIHSHQQEFVNGYISLRGGHRAGICGTAVLKGESLAAVRDITSINLRVAREIPGAANGLVEKIFRKSICGTLIVGVPASGKTTLLRDLARQLSNGEAGQPLKIAVVDERGELGAVYEGIPQNDLGACSDILTGYPKGVGILTAVRTLSPDVIICDEIGAKAEVDSILDGLNCGVKIVATAHAATLEELLSRRQISRLLQNGAFDKIVLLGDAEAPGLIEKIVEVGELADEAVRFATGRSMLCDDRYLHGVGAVQAGGCD